MNVLVDQVGWYVVQAVGFKVEVLQLPLVVQGCFSHHFDAIVVQRQPKQLVKRFDQTLGKVPRSKAETQLEVLQRGTQLKQKSDTNVSSYFVCKLRSQLRSLLVSMMQAMICCDNNAILWSGEGVKEEFLEYLVWPLCIKS